MEDKFIIDQTQYQVGVDTDGTLTTFKPIQDIVFSIILEIDRICRKNNIPYALAFGSTLGLYNYQGFIPWDDDADIAIDYFDIPRLIEAFKNDLSDEFEFVSYETNPKFNTYWPTFKVKKKTGYMQDKNYKRMPDRTNTYEGFFVDIVAFMGMKNKFLHFMHILRRQIQIPFYYLSDAIFNHDPQGMKRRMKKAEAKLANKHKDAKYVCQSVILPFQNASVNLYPRDIIYPFKEYEFNGVKLYSFNNIKEFCRIRYGERSLKYWDGEKYIDRLNKKYRRALHINKFHIDK